VRAASVLAIELAVIVPESAAVAARGAKLVATGGERREREQATARFHRARLSARS
jgi:hypothetical protein